MNHFQTVLIANRGAIARRIARTCKELGYKVLMIYAQNDRHLPLLEIADEVYCCDYTAAADIIALAQSTRAAVHPGYGFLSERADFAAACAEAGVPFIGPDATALAIAGQKHRCAERLSEMQVPLLPHVILPEQELSSAGLTVQSTMTYPVMVKPTAAGGGLGMQWVDHPEQLAEALQMATLMGQKYFQQGDVLIEKALESARHIEVQILADRFGQVKAVGHRECSLQRRRQKVFEESPAVGLPGQHLREMLACAEHIAQHLGLNQVCTVEFLWDGRQFWFLEVNPRLQVEHAVTEVRCQSDLVACQLAIAQGESLDSVLDTFFTGRGHAMEARIYAENPYTGLPAGGRIVHVEYPTGQGIRLDSGIYPGMQVSTSYDPLLMKVIAHATDRDTCRQRLLYALRTLIIQGEDGFATNQPELIQALEQPDVVAGHYHTRSLEHPLTTASDTSSAASFMTALTGMSQSRMSQPRIQRESQEHSAYAHWRPVHWKL